MVGLIVRCGGYMITMSENETSNIAEWPFEQAIERLEAVVQALEGGELSLDDAIENYRLGMQLAKICREKLTAAEQKVEKVLASDKGLEFEPFDIEEV